MASFPVEDLLKGYIMYDQSDHDDKEPTTDSFELVVEDGENRSPLSRLTIDIQVCCLINLHCH